MIVEFKESFERDLKKIKDQKMLDRVRDVLIGVEKAEILSNIKNLKKLKDKGNYFRIKIGDYRIGIKLENGVVIFVRFLHRKELYRYFP